MTYSRSSLQAFSKPEANNNSGHGPMIHPELSGDVVAVLGKEARLKCYVTNIGNKTVRRVGGGHTLSAVPDEWAILNSWEVRDVYVIPQKHVLRRSLVSRK